MEFRFQHTNFWILGTLDIVTAMTYDNLGNQTSITDPEGHTTHFTHDIMGHVLPHVSGKNENYQFYRRAGGSVQNFSHFLITM